MTPITTLVVPVFNEGTRLSVAAFTEALREMPYLRFHFMDDGSTDETPAVLARLAEVSSARVAVTRLPSNRGKAEAVRLGLLAALEEAGDLVGYWDADLATPLDELPGFIEAFQQDGRLQVVIGSRVRLLGRRIERQALRHYLGRVFATAASLILRMPVYDTQCGAKVFRKGAGLADCLREPFQSRWLFDVELLARLDIRSGGDLASRAVERPLRRWHDIDGSHLRAVDLMRVPWELSRMAVRHRRRLAELAPRGRPARASGEGQ